MEAAASPVERQAEVRLPLGWLPGLEWVKGLLMKHESALKLGEGAGGGRGDCGLIWGMIVKARILPVLWGCCRLKNS